MRNELQGLWCFATIAVYAAGYAATKDIIKNALEPHKGALAPIEPFVLWATLAGTLVTGIIADKVSARAAVNVSMLASASIYGATFLLLEGKAATGFFPQVAIAAKALTALQHAMFAVTAYACIRQGTNASHTALSSVLTVGLGYTTGNVAATLYASKVGNDIQIVIASGFAHVICVILSWLMRSPQAMIVGRKADGSLRGVAAPGTRRSLVAVTVRFLPHIFFVLAVRSLRVFAQASRGHLQPGPSPFWDAFAPLTVDQAGGLASNLFVIPALMLFARGPGAVLGIAIVALLATRAAMAYDPSVMESAKNSQLFSAVFTVGAATLYTLPTAVLGIAAEPGTKGRVLALQAVVSAFVYYKADAVRTFLVQQASKLAPTVAPGLMLAEHELEFAVFVVCALVSLVMLPGAAHSAPVVVTESVKPASAPGAASARRPASSSATPRPAAVGADGVATAMSAASKPVLKKKK